MTRSQTAHALAGLSAVAFFVAAGLHAADYRNVVLRVAQGFSGLTPLVGTLWLAFVAALAVLGGIVTLVALGRVSGARWVLAVAGCFPLITVILQANVLGFTRWTAMLSAVALITFAAALAFPPTQQPRANAA